MSDAGGLVIVDKPQGWTSHDVVARVRRLAGTRKVGHAGTLDPMATGVLVVGVEKATRLLTYVVGADKEYRATIRLGRSTTTDDAEGELVTSADPSAVTPQEIAAGAAALTGAIAQVPSAVSAIKVDGKRAYARVRAGEDVQLAARTVVVSRFDVHEVRGGVDEHGPVLDVDVTVECSSGTYVRALARDLGTALGVGGHLTALRRTRVGAYGVDLARTLDDLAGDWQVLPLAEAARALLPSRELDETERAALAVGRRIGTSPDQPTATEGTPVAAFAPDGTLVALLGPDADPARQRPLLVFAPA